MMPNQKQQVEDFNVPNFNLQTENLECHLAFM